MSLPDRLHYFDNLRALAMVSGVVFHAALAYSPLMHPFFPTADRDPSVIVDVGLWFLHLFRMPLFFVIAGYFAARLVARRGMGGLFRNRLQRIALPLLVFWPLVHWAMGYSTQHAATTVANPSPMLVMIGGFLSLPDPPVMPPSTYHLWFLYYLLLFYVLAWVARSLELGKRSDVLGRLGPTGLLGLLPLALVPALSSVTAPHPAPESFLPLFWALGFYGPFFAAGYLLHGREDAIDRLRAATPWLLGASLLLYLVFWQLLHRQAPAGASASLPLALVEAFLSVWMTCVCLVAGKAWLNRKTPLLRVLSESAYWTYLVHLPILFAIQYPLLDSALPWVVKLVIATVGTTGICLLSYYGIVRRSFIGGMLGARVSTRAAGVGAG